MEAEVLRIVMLKEIGVRDKIIIEKNDSKIRERIKVVENIAKKLVQIYHVERT